MSDDVLGEFEPLIDAAEAADADSWESDLSGSPWERDSDGALSYRPNVALLTDLLTGPVQSEASTQSGRLAKAFDAWLSYELRRAQFKSYEVWPRNRTPRVWSKELDSVAEKVHLLASVVERVDVEADAKAQRLERSGDGDAVAAAVDRLAREHARLMGAYERQLAKHPERVAKAEAGGKTPPEPPSEPVLPERVPISEPLPRGLRQAINGVLGALPTNNGTNILGRFYVKQVDVVVSSWDRGPDVLISGKTMFSSFAKNTKNRYEETLGEASNLRDRYPLAAMGYAFLVSDDIFKESGAYGRLQDLLLRTRKPYGPYDATMLLIATWDGSTETLTLTDPLTYPDPAVSQQQPPVDLSASRFFTDLLNCVIVNTPVGVHQNVRTLRNGTPVPGGTPDPAADAESEPDE